MQVIQSSKNVEKWMGRLRISAEECNYKEVDGQKKNQFIHGVNDNDMIIDVIKRLTKLEDNSNMESEQVLV